MAERPNVSSDLLWEIVRNQNAYLVKSKSAGGVQFSRDPFNLRNKHSKKHAGFINDKAVAVQGDENGSISLKTKKSGNSNKPGDHHHQTSFGKTKSNRSTYKSVANAVGKNSYRSDINGDAVSRASALKKSQRPKKDTSERKPRGVQARKQAAAE